MYGNVDAQTNGHNQYMKCSGKCDVVINEYTGSKTLI